MTSERFLGKVKSWIMRHKMLSAILAILILPVLPGILSAPADTTGSVDQNIAAPPEATPTIVEPAQPTPPVVVPTYDDTFATDFHSLCSSLVAGFTEIGLNVECQNHTVWQANHALNPATFPYEYRDIDISDDTGDFSITVTMVRDSANMEHFRSQLECENLFNTATWNCVTGEARNNIIYHIASYRGETSLTQSQLDQLSTELRTVLVG